MYFNLLPWRAKRDRRHQQQFYGVVMALSVFIALGQFWMFSHLQALAEQQAKQVAKHQARLAEHEAASALWAAKQDLARVTENEIREAWQALQALQKASEPIGDWLVDLMAARPPGVWIENFWVRPIEALPEAEVDQYQPAGSAQWVARISGQVVLDADLMHYQGALVERFGRQQSQDRGHAPIDTMAWLPVDRLVRGLEASPARPPEHSGLESFLIEQQIEVERP